MARDQHPEAVIVHSSDLHLGTDDSFSERDSLTVLPKVLMRPSKRAPISSSSLEILLTITASLATFSNERRKFCAITAIPSLFCPAITTR